MPAFLLSRLAQRDAVCRDAEAVDKAFAAALGGGKSASTLSARCKLVKEKVQNGKDPMHLGPDRDLHLLRQRVIFEMVAAEIDFFASSARALVRCLQKAGCSSLEPLVAVVGSTPP